MSGIEARIHTYKEFIKVMLPRVKYLGYNCIQLMAVQEHSLYSSFGYLVTNFFAVSSKYGEPDDLKEMIDACHGEGINVIIDIVHSHASSNVNDGLPGFNGSNPNYFHKGERGFHSLWKSALFDYGKWEVQRFLLSNLRWFMEEYQFDGFRFDGVTSMMYKHHGNPFCFRGHSSLFIGIAYGFSGNYAEYFNEGTNWEGILYLMLANHLIHLYNPV